MEMMSSPSAWDGVAMVNQSVKVVSISRASVPMRRRTRRTRPVGCPGRGVLEAGTSRKDVSLVRAPGFEAMAMRIPRFYDFNCCVYTLCTLACVSAGELGTFQGRMKRESWAGDGSRTAAEERVGFDPRGRAGGSEAWRQGCGDRSGCVFGVLGLFVVGGLVIAQQQMPLPPGGLQPPPEVRRRIRPRPRLRSGASGSWPF